MLVPSATRHAEPHRQSTVHVLPVLPSPLADTPDRADPSATCHFDPTRHRQFTPSQPRPSSTHRFGSVHAISRRALPVPAEPSTDVPHRVYPSRTVSRLTAPSHIVSRQVVPSQAESSADTPYPTTPSIDTPSRATSAADMANHPYPSCHR